MTSPRVRVNAFSVSLDGYGAGPRQDQDNPIGAGGLALMEWIFPTRTWQALQYHEGGETGTDDRLAGESLADLGAWILGRNMFGPVRGPWPDDSWKGWWGEEPPYHCPVFVLTHHARPALPMKGGTVFHFVTDGISEALERAREAAGDKDIRVGGGVATIRQFLQAGLIDEVHLALRPVLLGQGEALFAGLDLPALGYEVARQVRGERATHVSLRRSPRTT
jgi:dihydrofolate reductase